MADQNRQIKLAAAKKKLKEFQQKATPPTGSAGVKKKRRVRGGDQPDGHTLEKSERFPSVVSNGLSHSQAEPQEACEVVDGSAPQICSTDANADGHRPLSSTESLRQLSQQLNGLLSESTSYVNGDGGGGAGSQREPEDPVSTLDSGETHTQLTATVETLTRQSQDLSDQLQKERREFEQKFNKEQGAMREQLQVHIQTIGILVSEKSELQTALGFTQQAARQKTVEAEELSSRLQASKQRVSELERTLSTVSAQHKSHEKLNRDLEKERDSLRLEVLRVRSASEESTQQSSELTEQLRLQLRENEEVKQEVQELRRRLEMSDVMLQQFSGQAAPPSEQQKLQILIEEKRLLELHASQTEEVMARLRLERDQFSAQMLEDGRVWKDKTEQLLSQMRVMSEEREQAAAQVQELQDRIVDLEKDAAALRRELEASDLPQTPGPSHAERSLQETLSSLEQERHALALQYQAQVQDNAQLSALVQEQERRVEELELQVERAEAEAGDRLRILEGVQSDKATISRALAQNRELKEQLAELQSGFVRLTNENVELTSGLQSEQHVKRELVRRMSQLQEERHHAQEQLQERVKEAAALQQQRDQCLSHLQHYSSAYQQLLSQRQHLLQLTEHTTPPTPSHAHHQSPSPQEHTERDAAVPDTGELSDGPETPGIVIPEDFQSREELEEFVRSALSQLTEERDVISRRLEEVTRLHHHHHQPHDTSSETGVPLEVHKGLMAAMEQLQQRFTRLMQEKVDLRERVEELEHRCIQLSGETDTIGEYIALYQNQRAIMKQKHQEKEQYISLLAKDKEEMKVKLAELQDLVMRLVGERNEWYSRYMRDVSNTHLQLENQDQIDSTDSPAVLGVALAGDVPLAPGECVGAEAEGSGPREDGTARQIMQLLQEIQNPQARATPFLGENPCVPFFYRPDQHDEVKILLV